jgi:hypothetical protein
MEPLSGITTQSRVGPFPVGGGNSSLLVIHAPSIDPERVIRRATNIG